MLVESGEGCSGSPVLMLLFRPNYQPLYEPIGEFPAIESFGETLDSKCPPQRVSKCFESEKFPGLSTEKRTPGRKLDYLKRLENEHNR